MTWNRKYEWYERVGGGFIAHEVGVVLEFTYRGRRYLELVPACEYKHHRVSFAPPNLRNPKVKPPVYPLSFRVLEERPSQHQCPKCFCRPLGHNPDPADVAADVQRRIARYLARKEKDFYGDPTDGLAGLLRFNAAAAVAAYDERCDDRPDPQYLRLTSMQYDILEILRTQRRLVRDPMPYAALLTQCRTRRRTNCDGQIGRAVAELRLHGAIAVADDARREGPVSPATLFVAVY